MIENFDIPIIFNNQVFTGIKRLGFSEDGGSPAVDLWTTPTVPPGNPRGGFFTSIPISGLAYRQAHGSRAAYERKPGRLIIYDDHSKGHVLEAPAAILDALEADCIANKIPESIATVLTRVFDPARSTILGL
jgi:hypothetical protein